jgi:hypothetical protein
MHEDFLSYIMIGLSRGFTPPRIQQHDQRFDGSERFPQHRDQPTTQPAAASERPIKARSQSIPLRQRISRLLRTPRLGRVSACR